MFKINEDYEGYWCITSSIDAPSVDSEYARLCAYCFDRVWPNRAICGWCGAYICSRKCTSADKNGARSPRDMERWLCKACAEFE